MPHRARDLLGLPLGLALLLACARAPSAKVEALAELPPEPAPSAAEVVAPEPEPEPEPEPPPITRDLVELLAEEGGHEELLAALERAGLVELLRDEGPRSLLAPSDAAFAALSKKERRRLEDPKVLGALLRRHVLAGRLTVEALAAAGAATTIDGEALVVERDGDAVRIGGASVSRADLEARNGLVHTIDRLLPPAPRAKAGAKPGASPKPGADAQEPSASPKPGAETQEPSAAPKPGKGAQKPSASPKPGAETQEPSADAQRPSASPKPGAPKPGADAQKPSAAPKPGADAQKPSASPRPGEDAGVEGAG